MRYILLIILSFSFASVICQEEAKVQIFKDTRVINAASVETLPARKLDIRIGHRFGDFAGDFGGWSTFYGLESARDVLIGFDLGISDNFMIGLNRTKGAGPLKQLINSSLKYKVLNQTKDGMPISLAVLAGLSASTMKSSTDSMAINFFDATAHRMIYTAQLILGKSFADRVSIQLTPSYVHRNIVSFNDENGIFSLGLASKIQLTKAFGAIFDFTFPFSDYRTTDNGYYPSIGVGLEIDTGGHRFQLNFTNSRGMSEADYIPYTTSNWADGQFRLGFTISRMFNL